MVYDSLGTRQEVQQAVLNIKSSMKQDGQDERFNNTSDISLVKDDIDDKLLIDDFIHPVI